MIIIKKNIPLHTKIIIGMLLGLVWAIISIVAGFSPTITTDYIKPIGTIFINLLKLTAVPLILASLVTGVASLNDMRKLSRIGGRTITLYIFTTMVAISIGLVCVNIMKPGLMLSVETRDELIQSFQQNENASSKVVKDFKQSGPLQFLVEMIPSNIFLAASDNRQMLQVVFFAVLLGIALISIPSSKSEPVIGFFDGMNEVILKIVGYIMLLAPFGVFALISGIIVEFAGKDPLKALNLLHSLFWYGMTVLMGLILHTVIVYTGMLKIFTRKKITEFYKAIRPVHLLAFSTSSSNATLPVTIECAQKNLGVPEDIASFVLPLGATINMDGTSLYQGVATVFIAQALNIDLSFSAQLMIVLTATLASVGTAGVPGAGMIMLIIVLESVHVPVNGIALIVAIDRILDMCRTVVNITGDLVVAVMMNEFEKKV